MMTAIPFLNKNGVIIAMKGAISDHDIRILGSSVHKGLDGLAEDSEKFELHVKRYALPYLKLNRSMVCVRKIQV